MSLGRRFLISLPGATLFAAAAMAQVAPTTVFQLDGNAASTPASCSYGPCDYWDLLNGTGNNISELCLSSSAILSGSEWAFEAGMGSRARVAWERLALVSSVETITPHLPAFLTLPFSALAAVPC